ncbi:PLP-dependent aminotransferase family protein [Serratia sp. M24T3]|uniref:MocR-like pyridoxine biosynthesis transcription factor PdxR n=1 Tax=Serratia sp. M24T3 TaxID=932213 RepID=UPI00025B8E80|nr:PLP-dependent aminotransferase family protein [Serratia sp. M24T3]EIC84885.1 GntR family transcriptional regulator [Serratia sp. M24T3]
MHILPLFGLIIDTNLIKTIRPILSEKNLVAAKKHYGALIQLFEQSEAPLFSLRDRLCAALRLAIGQGALAPLQRLPSSRLLAADLGISRITVEAAYGQIEAEGYITRQVGKGTFVSVGAAIAAMPKVSSKAKTLNNHARYSEANPPVVLSARGAAIIATGGCKEPLTPLPFAAGSPDLRVFPLKLWRQLTNKSLRLKGEKLLGYGDPHGYLPLREAIAGYLQQSRGVACHAAQIVVTTSSQQSLQLLATLLIDNGDPLWLEEPGYLGARNAFTSAGATIHAVPVDPQGMNLDASLPIPRLIYLTPSHQYPTGVSMSLSRRIAMLEYARFNQSWIIEDDYDSELHYDGRPLPAMQGLDHHQRVIYVGTFSKVLFPSLRLAYMVLPPSLVEPIIQLRTVYDGHSAQLMQAVTAEFIQQGHFAAHLRYMRQLYQRRRDHLLEQINDKLGSWVDPLPTAGGLQLAVKLPSGQEAELTRQAHRFGVITPPLSPLYLSTQDITDTPHDGWLLGFSALTPPEITAAVDRLALMQQHLGHDK